MRTYLEKTSARHLWRAEDVGQILDVSPKTVHKLVREGKLACVQVTARERRFKENLDHRLRSRRKSHARGRRQHGHRKGALK